MLIIIATEMKEKIAQFKEEKIGGRRRDFVETVKTATDSMNTSPG